MAFQKMQKPKYPPRQWAIYGDAGAGKSHFASQMKSPALVIDADGRFTEQLDNAAGEIYQLSDNHIDNTDPDRIAWSCRDYLYHLQDAWYSEPLRLEGASPRFLLVFVPKTPPHTPVAVRFDDDLRADGRELMRRGLDELALRRRSGDWLADHHKAPITVGRRGWRP